MTHNHRNLDGVLSVERVKVTEIQDIQGISDYIPLTKILHRNKSYLKLMVKCYIIVFPKC